MLKFLEYCISISSSRNSNCVGSRGEDYRNHWAGDPVTVYHNNLEIGKLPRSFTHEEFCFPAGDVDVVNDEFKFVNGGADGVSLFCEKIMLDKLSTF